MSSLLLFMHGLSALCQGGSPEFVGFFVFFSAVVVCLFSLFLVYLQAILVSWQSIYLFSIS